MLIQANDDNLDILIQDRAMNFISKSSEKRSKHHADLVKSNNKLAESIDKSNKHLTKSNERQDKADEEECKVILKIMETKQENMRVMTPAAKGVFDSWEYSCAFSPSSQSLGGADTLHDEALPI